MIDLNDVWTPPARIDLAAVKAQLAATASDWLPGLFPQARLSADRRTLRCADLSGRPPRKEGSCILHLDGPYAGWGFDFSTGERAGPVDLIYHGTGLTDGALFEEAARLARMDRVVPPRPARPKVDYTLEVRRILDGCLPLAGSPAETYLRSRGLSDPASADLLYHPDLTDYDEARGRPGMVAVPRRADGAPAGGIHRTFLLDDGSGKAPAGKKMLGAVGDGAVRLFPLPADGHLGIAEGIETALAAHALFGTPVWAALSADGMARWQWPADVRRVTIFGRCRPAGSGASGRPPQPRGHPERDRHPVRDHLGALAWDGVPRIETWACRYLGAEATAFNRSVGALWLISAVARIFRPGVKADHLLVLEGPQGARKSTALKILAGEDWFTDELPDLGSKDAAMHMQGVWIIEIAELDAIGKAEVSRIKAFLTRTTDRFRPPYGRYTIEVPRQCVFAGTVNPDTYLRDETGNRRFWPVRCGAIDIDALARDRDQLWAEAVARFRAGAIWWLDTPELIAAATVEQDKRYQADVWGDLIDHWITHEVRTVTDGGYGPPRRESVPRSVPLASVSMAELLGQAVGLEPGRWGRAEQMRVSAHLKKKGWERYREEGPRGEPREWRYRRGRDQECRATTLG